MFRMPNEVIKYAMNLYDHELHQLHIVLIFVMFMHIESLE